MGRGGRFPVFNRIRLENWRNFVSVDVALAARAFLVGPNASGKSNFLDALRFLRELAVPGGGFQNAIQNRGGVSRIRCLAARRYPEVVLAADLSLAGVKWTYELAIRQDNQRRPKVAREVVLRDGRAVVRRPEPADEQDDERLTQTALEQVSANKSFRDVADYFASVRYLHIVPQLVREPDRSVGRQADPFGGDFLEQLGYMSQKTRDSRLRKIKEALRVAVPQLTDLRWQRDEKGTAHLNGLYEHWRPNAGWQSEDQFSDGTLRLFGLLWVLLDTNGTLLLEEPELSLHPAIVRRIPHVMNRLQRGRSQIVVSTHSSDLLSDEGIDAHEVLLLQPSGEGTHVVVGSEDAQIRTLLEGGMPVSEAVLPRTEPARVSQLSVFGR